MGEIELHRKDGATTPTHNWDDPMFIVRSDPARRARYRQTVLGLNAGLDKAEAGPSEVFSPRKQSSQIPRSTSCVMNGSRGSRSIDSRRTEAPKPRSTDRTLGAWVRVVVGGFGVAEAAFVVAGAW